MRPALPSGVGLAEGWAGRLLTLAVGGDSVVCGCVGATLLSSGAAVLRATGDRPGSDG